MYVQFSVFSSGRGSLRFTNIIGRDCAGKRLLVPLSSSGHCGDKCAFYKHKSQGTEARLAGANELAVPPLDVGEAFGHIYEVFLVLDSREQFRRDARGGAALQKFADRIGVQFKVQVETRQLPVVDALWIARHKVLRHEYVLDFIVERKRVDDIWSSIKDNRYKQQKLRLCGVKRLLYLIEGDPNLTDASEPLKTTAFTTEILEGFDVQRTRDMSETVQKYGELTSAIIDRYALEEIYAIGTYVDVL